ncbi:MAG: SUMF1/EgtB/PvdO family nonheme iron enzyme [Polyangiales bacterium]
MIRRAAGAYTIELLRNDQWGPMEPQPFTLPEGLPVLLLCAERCRTAAEQRSGVVRDATPVHFGEGASVLDEATEKDPLDALGRMLAAAIFQGEIRSRYDRALGSKRPIRMRLHVPDDLAHVPWEVTKTADGKEFIALSGTQHIVRVSDAARAPSTVGGVKLRVLALAAVPKDLPHLEVDTEGKWLKGVLEPLMAAGLVDVTWIEDGREDKLRERIIEASWDVFHFAGHGEVGSVSCCGTDGAQDTVTAEELARLLKTSGIKLVVLNSCKGAAGSVVDAIASTARGLSEKGIPAVVAMQYAISDGSALEFTRWFYKALAARKTLEEAVAAARDSMAKRGGREWATPVVFLNRADGVFLRENAGNEGGGLGGWRLWLTLALVVILAAAGLAVIGVFRKNIGSRADGGPTALLTDAASSSLDVSEARGDAATEVAADVPGAECPPGYVYIREGHVYLQADASTTVPVGAYCIGIGEVTVREYAVCVEAGYCRDLSGTSCSGPLHSTWNQRNVWGWQYPLNCVTWIEASTYCHFVHGELPTEPQWKRAGRDESPRVYPWGNDRMLQGRVNACGLECYTRQGRTPAYPYDDGKPSVAPPQSFSGESPFGVFDLSGNLWEWTYPTDLQRSQNRRPYRGGSWSSTDPAQLTLDAEDANEGDKRWAHLGFRCAISLDESQRDASAPAIDAASDARATMDGGRPSGRSSRRREDVQERIVEPNPA